MPGPIMTFGPAHNQATALRGQGSPTLTTSTVRPGGSRPTGGSRSGNGTLAADYYGGVNAITGQRFGPSRAMPTDPRERAAIEARRRATQQALFGGRF